MISTLFSLRFTGGPRGIPMSLTRADIEKIAQLARLDLTEAEIPVYVDSLSRIMDFVGELDQYPVRQRLAEPTGRLPTSSTA